MRKYCAADTKSAVVTDWFDIFIQLYTASVFGS